MTEVSDCARTVLHQASVCSTRLADRYHLGHPTIVNFSTRLGSALPLVDSRWPSVQPATDRSAEDPDNRRGALSHLFTASPMKSSSFARFRFLTLLAIGAVAATLGLAGCGGSGGDGSMRGVDTSAKDGGSLDSNSSGGAVTTVLSGNSGSNVISLPPPSPVRGYATLRLTSSTSGTGLPFTAGYAFRQGEIPSGKYISAGNANLRGFQALVKNRWHDGSAKFAVLSGLVDLQANSEQTLTIGWTDVTPSGAALDLASLKATGISASISFGSYGTASWYGTAWDNPFLSPIAGPEMSSWVYRQPIGADQHLVAWMEVRLYRGGAVEIIPWIENGYLMRPSPGERSGMATFAINDSTRFSGSLTLYNHTRTVLVSGAALSHWLGGDPGITFRHDMGYLQLTGLVPAYRGITTRGSSALTRQATVYVPLAEANFPSVMGTAGYHPSIGPLPEWDVVYMTSDGDPNAWRSVQVNAYSAGRYGYHYRDEITNRAPEFSKYPSLVLGPGSGIPGIGSSSKGQLTPAASGGTPPVFTNSHMPAIGLMAYLVTGRWYFLDEMQLLTASMFLKQSDDVRIYSQGVLQTATGSNTTRGAAWTIRALTHAAAMTPDDDLPLKSELLGSVQANVDWYYSRYVSKPNNPLGLAAPYSDYTPGDGKTDYAIWMEDFLTWSFGNIKAMQGYAASQEDKLNQLLTWKYRSIVGRLGANESGQWSYRNAALYTVPYAPAELGNCDWISGAGPWYPSWGAAYAAAGFAYSTGTTLLGGYIDSDGLATSYWGNLQPAISYAVEQGALGAQEAYDRMVGSPNWQSAALRFNTDTPVWSVRPRNVAY